MNYSDDISVSYPLTAAKFGKMIHLTGQNNKYIWKLHTHYSLVQQIVPIKKTNFHKEMEFRVQLSIILRQIQKLDNLRSFAIIIIIIEIYPTTEPTYYYLYKFEVLIDYLRLSLYIPYSVCETTLFKTNIAPMYSYHTFFSC